MLEDGYVIIQCRKCKTKYKFDKSLIQGEGAWVRCSRCRHLFFQENPEQEVPAEKTESHGSQTWRDVGWGRNIPGFEIPDETEVPGADRDHRLKSDAGAAEERDHFAFVEEDTCPDTKESLETSFRELIGGKSEPEKNSSEDAIVTEPDMPDADWTVIDESREDIEIAEPLLGDLDIIGEEGPRAGDKAFNGEIDIHGIEAESEPQFAFDVEEPSVESEMAEISPGRDIPPGDTVKKSRGLRMAMVFLVVIILLSGVVWFYPQVGRQILDTLSPVIRIVTGDKGISDDGPGTAENKIYFTDMRERTIKNWIVGDVLVVQGQALNKYERSVSKIRIRGRLLDASGDELLRDEVYAGTILTEEELRNLTRDEIEKELENAFGRDFPNSDIPFQGEIPFMIVFCNPSENASEYLIDLANVEGESNKAD